jgi:hypothetical protein
MAMQTDKGKGEVGDGTRQGRWGSGFVEQGGKVGQRYGMQQTPTQTRAHAYCNAGSNAFDMHDSPTVHSQASGLVFCCYVGVMKMQLGFCFSQTQM